MNYDDTQQIVSFSTEGMRNSVADAVKEVTDKLTSYLYQQRDQNRNPIVVSLSQSSGHTGYTGYYASIIAVIDFK